MIHREWHDSVATGVRVGRTGRFLIFVLVSCALAYGGAAGEFVPFVIPARPNASSPIAIGSFEKISPDSGRLVVCSGHFHRGPKRIRLWGVNLSFGANLPRHEDAPYIAARLAAAGVNTVRCHHMDTARWPRGLWNAKDGKTITPEALDRLDFFIDQLARHGICVNINLHVGRAHSEYLGLPETNRKYDKISNIFTPALIEAQKDYARELLTRVNPYRKIRYADDPAVALVEITNENSFFMWASEDTLRTLPPYYADILQGKFNGWLKGRYGSDEKLRRVWAEGIQPLGKNLLANGDFKMASPGASLPRDWNLEQHSGCKASVSVRPYKSQRAACIEVGKADQTMWHLQLSRAGFPVSSGQYYTVAFQGAAGKRTTVGCSVNQAHDPWANLGLWRAAALMQDWQQFRFGFTAKEDDDNARISFLIGGSEVPVYLANVEFRQGGRLGLAEGESIDTGNVALFADYESPQRVIDRMRFLAETEKAYFDDMRDFIKNDLGCGALVTGTIVYGPLGLYAQSDMDFIDVHAYWQHPRFPGRPWDAGNWLVDQKPMVDHPEQATLFRLASQRLEGKPYTVSEYNHPAPLDSQAECVPMIASFGATQDWDGVWLYTYSHSSDEWYRENMNSYFDIDTNPAKWGFMRAATAIFRHAGIEQLSNLVCVSLTDSSDVVAALAALHLKHDRNLLAVLGEKASVGAQDILDRQIVTSLGKAAGSSPVASSDTRLVWPVADANGFYAAFGQEAWVVVGHAERFEAATGGLVVVDSPDFVAMTVTALDKTALQQSQSVLITVCGRCENTGMEFSEDRRTVGRNWGGPPVRIQTARAAVTLRQGRWTCQAIGPDGLPKHQVDISYQDGQGVLQLEPKYGTMWYLLTRVSGSVR